MRWLGMAVGTMMLFGLTATGEGAGTKVAFVDVQEVMVRRGGARAAREGVRADQEGPGDPANGHREAARGAGEEGPGALAGVQARERGDPPAQGPRLPPVRRRRREGAAAEGAAADPAATPGANGRE